MFISTKSWQLDNPQECADHWGCSLEDAKNRLITMYGDEAKKVFGDISSNNTKKEVSKPQNKQNNVGKEEKEYKPVKIIKDKKQGNIFSVNLFNGRNTAQTIEIF